MTLILIYAACVAVILGLAIFFIVRLESETKITLNKVREDIVKNTIQLSDEELIKEIEQLDVIKTNAPFTKGFDDEIKSEVPKKKKQYKKKTDKKD
jgi:hypothetical protein